MPPNTAFFLTISRGRPRQHLERQLPGSLQRELSHCLRCLLPCHPISHPYSCCCPAVSSPWSPFSFSLTKFLTSETPLLGCFFWRPFILFELEFRASPWLALPVVNPPVCAHVSTSVSKDCEKRRRNVLLLSVFPLPSTVPGVC